MILAFNNAPHEYHMLSQEKYSLYDNLNQFPS